jgi:hypothetical protein
MRTRLLALSLVAGAAVAFAVPAHATALQYGTRCTAKVDTQCYTTKCGFVDCTTYDCVVYVNLTQDPLLGICVGQARPQT